MSQSRAQFYDANGLPYGDVSINPSRDPITNYRKQGPHHITNRLFAGTPAPTKLVDTVQVIKNELDSVLQTAKNIKLDEEITLPWEHDKDCRLYSTDSDKEHFFLSFLESRLGFHRSDTGRIDETPEERQDEYLQVDAFSTLSQENKTLLKQAYINKFVEIDMNMALMKAEKDFRFALYKWIIGEGPDHEYKKCWWAQIRDTDPANFVENQKKKMLLHLGRPSLSKGSIAKLDGLAVKVKFFLDNLYRKMPATEEECYLWYKYIVTRDSSINLDHVFEDQHNYRYWKAMAEDARFTAWFEKRMAKAKSNRYYMDHTTRSMSQKRREQAYDDIMMKAPSAPQNDPDDDDNNNNNFRPFVAPGIIPSAPPLEEWGSEQAEPPAPSAPPIDPAIKIEAPVEDTNLIKDENGNVSTTAAVVQKQEAEHIENVVQEEPNHALISDMVEEAIREYPLKSRNSFKGTELVKLREEAKQLASQGGDRLSLLRDMLERDKQKYSNYADPKNAQFPVLHQAYKIYSKKLDTINKHIKNERLVNKIVARELKEVNKHLNLNLLEDLNNNTPLINQVPLMISDEHYVQIHKEFESRLEHALDIANDIQNENKTVIGNQTINTVPLLEELKQLVKMFKILVDAEKGARNEKDRQDIRNQMLHLEQEVVAVENHAKIYKTFLDMKNTDELHDTFAQMMKEGAYDASKFNQFATSALKGLAEIAGSALAIALNLPQNATAPQIAAALITSYPLAILESAVLQATIPGLNVVTAIQWRLSLLTGFEFLRPQALINAFPDQGTVKETALAVFSATNDAKVLDMMTKAYILTAGIGGAAVKTGFMVIKAARKMLRSMNNNVAP
jgi:hypothetical protein